MIVDILDKIKQTPGQTKQTILRENLTSLKQILDDCYTANVYGVLKYNISTSGDKTIDVNYGEFHNLLKRLSVRQLTGNEAVEAVSNLVNQFAPRDQEYLDCVLKHNMRIGITEKTFKEIAYPNEFHYEVALAKNIKDVKNVNPIDGSYFASRKLDGVRCTCAFGVVNREVSDIEFISRTNHPFTTLDNLKPFIREVGSCIETDNIYVFDGECCSIDDAGNEDFKSIMKVVTKKNYTIPNPAYRVFDLLTMDEFMMKTTSPIFSERYETIQQLFQEAMTKSANHQALWFAIHPLLQERITCQEDFERWKEYVHTGNWEGFMLRKDVPYENGRTKNLLKVKEFFDAEFVVNSIETGRKTYSEAGRGNVDYENCCTGLNITFKGNTVTVGSGLTKQQSFDWAKDPSKIIGKTITVQYFEETVDDKTGLPSLRFPTLKFVYEDGRNT
jgi:DNA ligase-1